MTLNMKSQALLLFFRLLLADFCATGQNIRGHYINREKTDFGRTFVTIIHIRDDLTFEYAFQGDLFNDSAIGTYAITDNLITLKYSTPDYLITSFNSETELETNPPTTVTTRNVIKLPIHGTHLRPKILKIKQNRLIAVHTNNSTQIKIGKGRKFKRFLTDN